MEFTYDFFAHGELPEDVWKPLAESGVPLHMKRGQHIYMQNEAPQRFYYLVSGRVSSYISSEEGEERQLTVYGRGDIFGEASFFDGLPRVSSAIALTDCQIVAIDRDALLSCFADHPDLALSLMGYLARTVRMLSEHVDSISFQQVPQRLASHLDRLCRGENSAVHCTHEELGKAIGASRVSVSRALTDFADQGWISTAYRTIQVLDIQALKHFSDLS